MSDFDRNIATARPGYRTDQVAIDAGLRAYMIRVYNYMAGGVALTGARGVAHLSGRRRVSPDRGRAYHRTDVVRPDHLQGPLTIVLLLGRSAWCSSELPHQSPLGGIGAVAVLRLCRRCSDCRWRRSFSIYRRVDHAGVLHLGSDVRRHEPVRLHHPARPDRRRLVHVHGPDRHHHRQLGQHVPALERARLGDLGDRRARLRRAHRLRHAEHQGDV